MEMAVNESELFKNIFMRLTYPVLIFEMVNEGLSPSRLFEVNDAACSLLKYTKDELMNKEVSSLFGHLPPRIQETLKDLLLKNGQLSTILHLPDKNNLMITVEVQASLIPQGDQQLIFCMLKEYSMPCCHHEVLEEENNYLRKVMNTIQSFILILDKEGRISNWNNYTEQLTGYSLEEVQFKKFWDLFLIENTEKQRNIKNYLSGQIPSDYENFWLMKNGEKRFVKWKSTTINNPDGTIQFVLATGVDITAKVLALKESEKSKEKYKALVSSMNDLVFIIDDSFMITRVYGKWLKTNGFTKETFEGKSINNVLSHSVVHQKEVQKALAGETTEFEWEYEIKGKTHYFHSVLSPIILNGNLVKEIVGVTRDITDKKILEEHHKRIYEALTCGVVLQDTTGKIVYANKNASEILGFNEDELVNMSSFNEEWDAYDVTGEYFHAEEHPAMKTLRTGEAFSNVEMHIFNPAKKENRWILVDTRPIFEVGSFEKVEYVQATFHDITEKKEMDYLMHQSEKLALVGRLASGVVHEIRNPLTSIMGFLKLVEESQDPNKLYDFLPVIKMELDQINKFTNEFIEFSDSNDHEWKLANLTVIIQDALDEVKTELGSKDIKTLFESDSSKNLLLYCSESQLKQLFINLFKNSIEAMSLGGILMIKLESSEEAVKIIVIDNGKGISKERLKHLCEPYYSIKEKGTGMGLMRSLKIIHDHNGKINFSSEEGEGTTVTIELNLNQR